MKFFWRRLKYAWVNARRSTKEFKRNGIVFTPFAVICDPRKGSLSTFGYEVVRRQWDDTPFFDRYFEDEDEF